jgi:hypothetical protein
MLIVMVCCSGIISYTNGWGSNTLYTHSLGYKPFFYVYTEYCDIDSGNVVQKLRMCSFREYYGVGAWSRYYAYVDTTNLYLDVWTAFGVTRSLRYMYVVYYDPIT